MNNEGYAAETEIPRNEERILSPRADVVEDKTGVTLWLDLPGVEESALDLTIERDVLTVSAPRKVPVPEGVELRRGELANGVYKRSFALSVDLDSEKIDAELRNGVLTLRILKSEKVKPRKIQINSVH